jgi:stearoyl-CoA desaturase (delta-9 desaturase)
MTTILIFFVAHWYLSLFCQTFYLHRYGAHHLFIMNKFWEKFFHALTYVSQGSSFLSPRAYAVLHRMHHAYSDSEKDPHSPHHATNLFTMMWQTKNIYNDYLKFRKMPEDRFAKDLPEYPLIDKIGDTWVSRILWGTAYSLFYIEFVPAGMWYLYFLLPIHFLMGPVHGAIVNWCGHMYGYSNYDNNDKSKNSLVFDLLMGGELFQNNHHKFPTSAKFSSKWFEFDPTFPVIWLMTKVGIIKMNPKPLEIEMF